jgi:hypothetical protein
VAPDAGRRHRNIAPYDQDNATLARCLAQQEEIKADFFNNQGKQRVSMTADVVDPHRTLVVASAACCPEGSLV